MQGRQIERRPLHTRQLQPFETAYCTYVAHAQPAGEPLKHAKQVILGQLVPPFAELRQNARETVAFVVRRGAHEHLIGLAHRHHLIGPVQIVVTFDDLDLRRQMMNLVIDCDPISTSVTAMLLRISHGITMMSGVGGQSYAISST